MSYSVRIDSSTKSWLSVFARGEVKRRGAKVLAEAKKTCPVDQGRLRASLTLEIKYNGLKPYAVVGSPLDYAVWVHEGTGIYVGRGYITPKRAKVLAWPARRGSYNSKNGMVFAARVKGMRGRPWLVNALKAAYE